MPASRDARDANAVATHVPDLIRSGKLTSVARDGDTLSALAHAGALDFLSYVSTDGGAFLEWLDGKTLPGAAILQRA